MKHGANFKDQARIRELIAKGLSADEISVRLKIVKSCVASFFPKEESEDEESNGDQSPKASEAAAELAQGAGIDLATVTGTGADGNITKGDGQAVIDATGE